MVQTTFSWFTMACLMMPACLIAEEGKSFDLLITTPFSFHEKPKTLDFYCNDIEIGRGPEAFEKIIGRVAELPKGTSIVWGPDIGKCCGREGSEPKCLPKHLYPEMWAKLERLVVERNLTLSSGYPTPEVRPIHFELRGNGKKDRSSIPPMVIWWQNFHGPGTPTDEVLYFVNDEYLGRGNVGFGEILIRVDAMKMQSKVILPRYELDNSWAIHTLNPDEISRRNAKLETIVPFPDRTDELLGKIRTKKLQLSYDLSLQISSDMKSVFDWNSGDRYAGAIASFGRIIRHDEKLTRPAATLGWVRFDERLWLNDRLLETTARYTVDDVEMGEGVTGFAKAMDQIALLPEGAIVQARVCIRTKGPFKCPLIYEGKRHFERTGLRTLLRHVAVARRCCRTEKTQTRMAA